MSVEKRVMPKWMNFVIGGASGMMAICIVQPNDLIKTRMQLMGPKKRQVNMFTVARTVIRDQGGKGLYQGLTAALLRQATYTTGRFGIFNSLFDYYNIKHGKPPNLPTKVGFGMVAGGCGALIGTPAEVVLVRMMADGRLPPQERRNYKNVFNALSRITKEESVATLWRGTGATVTRAMVVNGAQLSTYSQAREKLLPKLGEGVLLHFVSSMLAGLVTSGASMPVDIVKTRVQNSAGGKVGQFMVLRNVIANEGVMALWSGFWPTYLKIGPHTVLTFMFLEQLNRMYFTMTR